VKHSTFWLLTGLAVALTFAASRLVTNDYFFFAGYVVLQYIVLATAWNVLGGYTGYINFGTSGFFAIGAYSSVGLTLRLKGVYFAIGTLALAVVAQTLVTNWDFVGGSRGVYIIRPGSAPLLGSYIHYLFLIMLILAGIAVAIARTIERSTLGYGLAAIRDDEQAAEAAGVPTLKLKLISTTVSGALMGMAGAPLPYYVTYLDPSSGFNLTYAVNAIAMPLVGGTTSWLGPVLGAIFLGTIQQAATVTISSSLNLLFVGVLLVLFVVIAPNGLIGLYKPRRRVGAAT
jgi:branched-chain amino acid transport system permease protein